MDKGKLTELLGRVEAATGPDRELDAAIASMIRYHPYGPFHWLDKSPEAVYAPTHAGWMGFTLPGEDGPRDAWASPEYTASVDAAIALVERVLPGQHLTMGQNVHHHYWLCTFNYLNDDGEPASNAQGMHKSSLPLAILSALLSALTTEASI